jgi:hypothetical protein
VKAPRATLLAFAAALLGAGEARATAPMLFGYGPRSTSLAQSDLADPSATAAPFTNPAFLHVPGTRVMLGYGHAFTRLKLNGKPTGLRDIAGTDVALQVGGDIGKGFQLGAGLAMHLPDRSLGRIAFYPGTEPHLVRFEPSSQRLTADMALAVRYGAVSLGAGAWTFVDAAGDGIGFKLAQDGNGAYADGNADMTMPYHFSPIAAAALDLGPAALALRYRGGQSVDLDLSTVADVAVTGNPLNGTTRVRVRGSNGYVPPTLDFGARYTLARSLKAHAALELALWSRAPSPSADLQMDVGLGMRPGLLEAQFGEPRMRDTLSPRLGLEWLPLRSGALGVRAGYLLSPSPVPRQTGFTSHADSTLHAVSAGAGYDLGKAWGVQLRADAAAMMMWLPERKFDKPSELLPFAHYTVSGQLLHLSFALEGAWK